MRLVAVYGILCVSDGVVEVMRALGHNMSFHIEGITILVIAYAIILDIVKK